MNVTTHLKEEENFLKISKHLKVVLSKFDDLSTIDRNDIYDLVYCRKKLESLLAKGIENKDIKADTEDLISRVDVLLKSINDTELDKIASRQLKKTSDLNKSKYDTNNKFKGLTDESRTDIKWENPMQNYLKRLAPKFIVMTICFLILMIPNSIEALTNMISELIDTISVIAPSSETAISGDVTSQALSETNAHMVNLISIVIRLITMCIFIVSSLGFCIDILYIMIPGFRYTIDKGRENNSYQASFISTEAMEAIKSEGYITVAKKINTNDRIEVAEALLNKSIECTNNWIDFALTYAIDCGPSKNALTTFSDIYNELQTIKGRTKIASLRNKIDAYVDAEIMYEKIEYSIEKEKELNNKRFENLKIIHM